MFQASFQIRCMVNFAASFSTCCDAVIRLSLVLSNLYLSPSTIAPIPGPFYPLRAVFQTAFLVSADPYDRRFIVLY